MSRPYKHKKANLNKYTQYGINPKFFGRQAARFPKSIKTQYCNIHVDWYPWLEPSDETTFTLRRSPALGKGTGCIESFNPPPEFGPNTMIAEIIPPYLGPENMDAIPAPALGPLDTSASIIAPNGGPGSLGSSIATPTQGPLLLKEVITPTQFDIQTNDPSLGAKPVKFGGRYVLLTPTRFVELGSSRSQYFEKKNGVWVWHGQENGNIITSATTSGEIQETMGNGWQFANLTESCMPDSSFNFPTTSSFISFNSPRPKIVVINKWHPQALAGNTYEIIQIQTSNGLLVNLKLKDVNTDPLSDQWVGLGGGRGVDWVVCTS